MPQDDDLDESNADPAGLRDLIRKLQRENKDLRPQAEQGTAATRKLAIYEAGITDPKVVKLLAKVHEGEWTPESIRETVAEYGFGSPSSSEPASESTANDDRQRAMADLSAVAAGNRGTSDTRKPAADDDEALNEELLALMAEGIPKTGKLTDKAAYMQRLENIMNKFQVQRH
jgi:hypothetical protein